MWRATIEATLANWEDLSVGRLGIAKPEYRFSEPRLEGTTATLEVEGDISLAARNALEPDVPDALYDDFPLWFKLDLEIARVENDDAPEFRPVVDPEKARALKESPLFRKR